MPTKQSQGELVKTVFFSLVSIFLAWIACLLIPLSYQTYKPGVVAYFHRMPFDPVVWQDEKRVYSDDPVRRRMLPSLLQTHALVGQTTEQIKTLLGPPMDRTEYTYYAEIFAKSLPSNALVYWIAPQEGVMAFKSIWLVLAPDSTGTINSFEILHAGLQDVRNPDCKSFQLFRIDQTTRRIFVPGYSPGYFKDMKKIPPLPAQLRQAHAYVTKCQPSWGERWNISFFTDSKFAGYKDENQLENFLRDGSWAENYLAEYDNSTSRLTLFPAQQKLRQVLSAKLSP